jgi:MoaA/NifB/PqqE/SkfB family radical SAM enzyme
MLSIDLNISPELTKVLIQKNEFAILSLAECQLTNSELNIADYVSIVSPTTSRFFVNLETHNTDLITLHGFDRMPHVRWVGMPIEVGSGVAQGAERIYSNVDEKSFDRFEYYKKFFADPSKLIPVFRPDGNRYQLGPTILKFFKTYNFDFAFIDPGEKNKDELVLTIREAFEYLRMRGFRKNLYFNFSKPNYDKWNAKTFNTFSGLKNVHMDLSNKCTHSCVFCGLWGPDFQDRLKEEQGGAFTQETKNFMNNQMPLDKALSIIEKMPETITSVQLGGAGDPLTHPNWLDILSAWRSRGFKTEVLSNFEYPTFKQIEDLHELARGKEKLCFFINVSAASGEVYTLVRPRQSSKIFTKVCNNLELAHRLKQRDGYGIHITLVHIINSLNYKEMPQMIQLSHQYGAEAWLKPLEIHSDIHRKYAIPKEEYSEFRKSVKESVELAKKLNVRLFAEEFLNEILSDESLG